MCWGGGGRKGKVERTMVKRACEKFRAMKRASSEIAARCRVIYDGVTRAEEVGRKEGREKIEEVKRREKGRKK